ncbi:MAG: peptidylprolyl isomerase [Verrucomicrobia bacterium]|nr:peptidylprolyl isomerase [Cytophagales bacterium]
MENRKLTIGRNIFCLFIYLCTHFFVNAVSAQRITVDKIVAKVDNYMILQSDLENTFLQYKESNPKMSAEDKCRILESLVINKVMVAKAEIDSVIVNDELVEDQLERRMQVMRDRFGGEDKIVKAYGKTIGELKGELRKQVKEQMTVQKMQEEINKNIKITPSEIKKFYNAIPKDSIPLFSTEVEVAQVVKLAKISKEQKTVTRQRLNTIRDRIETGEDFAAMAQAYSEDPGSGKQGGDLGWADKGTMVPEFESNAMKLKINEISKVFETEYGFHFIQLLERQGERYHARHILIRPGYAETDVEDANRYLDSLRLVIMKNDSLPFAKAAKLYSDDKTSSANGGLLQDPQSGSNKIFTENLESTVFFVIDTMQVGSISKPLPYRTDDGKTGVRILYYKSKIAPHQANLKDDWEKLQAAALGEKRNRRVLEWFKKAKNDVFIELTPEYKDCKLMEDLQ